MTTQQVIVRLLGTVDYQSCWDAMQRFTNERDDSTLDEIWLLQHEPVFTQGQNGKPEHLLNPGSIPIIQVDRGGQVTYHGPGQLVAYVLIDLKRKKFTIRDMVTRLENAIIEVLIDFGIKATAKREAPGVYVDDKKIASIGLRVRRGCSYHGLAFNVAMDLEPFTRINPCGFQQLEMTQIADFVPNIDMASTETKLMDYLMRNLGYNTHHIFN